MASSAAALQVTAAAIVTKRTGTSCRYYVSRSSTTNPFLRLFYLHKSICMVLFLATAVPSRRPAVFAAAFSSRGAQRLAPSFRRTPSTSATIMSMSTTSSSNTNDVDLLEGRLYVSIQDAMKVHKSNNDDAVAIVDGSWWLKGNANGQTAREAYEVGPRILGSQFFDIDDVADTTFTTSKGKLPHMMPNPALFGYVMDCMGITNNSHVILYGQPQCPFVHRSWYTFLSCGHNPNSLHILDGSLQSWTDAGGPIDDKPITAPIYQTKDWKENMKNLKYVARQPARVVDIDFVRDLVDNKKSEENENIIIVDARSSDRFYARVDEPRPGLRRGHMPGAKNLFFMDVLDTKDPVKLKPVKELQQIIKDFTGIDVSNTSNVEQQQKIVATCGSGATACTIAAAFIAAGKDPAQVSIYDGSWMEWGSYDDTPVATTDEEDD